MCVDVIDVNGFVKEEVQHGVVTVAETPAEHLRSRREDYVSASTFNAEACSKDELLSTCFSVPYDDVRQMLLGHNHIMLVT